MIIPLMPKIMSNASCFCTEDAKPVTGVLDLLVGGAKGVMPETPMKTLTLLGANERLIKLVISRSGEAILNIK